MFLLLIIEIECPTLVVMKVCPLLLQAIHSISLYFLSKHCDFNFVVGKLHRLLHFLFSQLRSESVKDTYYRQVFILRLNSMAYIKFSSLLVKLSEMLRPSNASFNCFTILFN